MINSEDSQAALQNNSGLPDGDEEPKENPGFYQGDLFQKITMTISTLVAIFSAFMAALMAFFIPQLCCPDVTLALPFFFCGLQMFRLDINLLVTGLCRATIYRRGCFLLQFCNTTKN